MCSLAGVLRLLWRLALVLVALSALLLLALKATLFSVGAIELPALETWMTPWLQSANYSVQVRGLALVHRPNSLLPAFRVQLLQATPVQLNHDAFVVHDADITLASALLLKGQVRIATLRVGQLHLAADLGAQTPLFATAHSQAPQPLPTLNALWNAFFAPQSFGEALKSVAIDNLTFDTKFQDLPLALRNGSVMVERHGETLQADVRGHVAAGAWLHLPIHASTTYDAATQQLSGTAGPGSDSDSVTGSLQGHPRGNVAFVLGNAWQLLQLDGSLQCTNCTWQPPQLPPIVIEDALLDARYAPQTGRAEIALSQWRSNVGQGSLLLQLSGLMANSAAVQWQLSGQANKLQYNNTFAAPLTIDGLNMTGRYTPATQQVQVGDIDLQTTGVRLTGTVDAGNATPTQAAFVRAMLRLNGLTAQRLLALWPLNVPGTARAWLLQNLEHATAQEGVVNIAAQWSKNAAQPPKIELKAQLPLTDVLLHYCRPMTPITNGVALLTLTQDTFDAVIKSANIGTAQVNGKFSIADINAAKPMGALSTTLNSSVPDLLNILDQPPLKLIRRNGIDPETTHGTVQGTLTMHIPLVQDLNIADIDFNVQTRINKGALPLSNNRWRLSNSQLTLQANAQKISAQGTAAVNTVPATLRWDMDLTGKQTPDTHINVQATASETELLNWNTDLRFMLQGKVRGGVDLTLHKGVLKTIEVKGDAAAARVTLPGSSVVFAAGQAKSFSLAGHVQPNDDVVFDAISFNSGDSSLRGSDLRINPQGVSHLQFDSLVVPSLTNAQGSYSYSANKGIVLQGKAKFLDVASYITPVSDAAPAQASDRIPPFELTIDTEQLRMGNDTKGGSARVVARTSHNGLGVEGSITPTQQSALPLQWLRHTTNPLESTFTTPNAGGVLNYFGLYKNLQGGKMVLQAHSKPNAPQQGYITITDAHFADAPTITKILSLASLQGAVSALTSQGLDAEYIKTAYTKTDSSMTFSDGVLRLPAVGISFRGDYNRSNETLAMEGAVIPFYSVNSLLNDIPLLGDILGNRSEEGLLGISYTLSGTTAAPDVSVNPLSVVTPGFLRGLFEK